MRFSFDTILKLSIFHPSNSHRYFPSSLVKSHTTKALTMNSLRHCCSASQPTTTTAASAVVSAAPQKEVKVKDAIELTETEKQIFERLVNTLRYFDLKTQLRVAGGWVRDKLLGKDCYDIDIALDDMLGSEFVEKVKEYLLSQGEEVQGLAVIPSNPEQSKHLETARMRLLDIWIDFVNLRSEKYSENSRIPTMTFGSAEEDALRRDLTINSLFYNINTSSVEDLTGRGIEDLKNGRIVTPLPPKETFLDDPLRVLRAIRFGARFGFVLDEKLKEAASCHDVKDALKAKVSRERIGTEIDLMISGNQPVKAMTHICDLGLFWVVFNLPKDCEPPLPQGSDWLCTAYMNAAWNLIEAIGHSTFTNDKKRIAFYSALFLPLRNTIYKDSKGRKLPVVSDIFRTSLKGKTNDAETVINVHNSSKKFLSMIPSLEFNKDCELIRVDWVQGVEDVPVTSKMRVLMGFLLRETKEFWRVSLLMSLLLHPKEIDSISDISEPNFQLNKRRELFQTVENTTERLGLTKVWEEKPLLNGKDIMSVLQLKTGGPLIKEWQQKVLAWQLAHPSGSAEECLEWMRESHSKRMKLQ